MLHKLRRRPKPTARPRLTTHLRPAAPLKREGCRPRERSRPPKLNPPNKGIRRRALHRPKLRRRPRTTERPGLPSPTSDVLCSRSEIGKAHSRARVFFIPSPFQGGQGVSRKRSPFCRSFRSDARRLKHRLFFLRVCANMLPKIHNSPFRPFRLAPLIR